MNKIYHFFAKVFGLPLLALAMHSAQATVVLEDWIFNIDGDITEDFAGDLLPTTGDLTDGFGTFSLEVTGGGLHNIIGYFDFELFQGGNTFFNESVFATGDLADGQSWEGDEPGFVFGDIVDNVFAGSLDNTTGVTETNREDAAFAMGWDFSLLDDDVATIDFVFTDILPTVDFFLTQADPGFAPDNVPAENLYFYSTLSIETSGNEAGPEPDPDVVDVPELSSLYLLVIALFVFVLRLRFKLISIQTLVKLMK